jgi:hypothetical protein
MNLSHHESHHSPWDFPCKPSSYWGTPMVPGPRPIKPTWEPPTHGQARKFPKGAHEEFGGRLPVHQQGKHLVKQGLNMFKP